MFTKTLSSTAKSALALLGKSRVLNKAYLAGGSALALHLGHRYSLDLDFFSQQKFDAPKVASNLEKIGKFQKEEVLSDTILGKFNTIKFSLFHYDYPIIAKLHDFLGIKIADPKDIAAMKAVAIMDRGKKRDFVDLYFLIRAGLTVEKIFKLYDKKYHLLEVNLFSLIKGLQYFIDAEDTEMPKMIKKVSWSKIKRFFEKEAVRLGKKYL